MEAKWPNKRTLNTSFLKANCGYIISSYFLLLLGLQISQHKQGSNFPYSLKLPFWAIWKISTFKKASNNSSQNNLLVYFLWYLWKVETEVSSGAETLLLNTPPGEEFCPLLNFLSAEGLQGPRTSIYGHLQSTWMPHLLSQAPGEWFMSRGRMLYTQKTVSFQRKPNFPNSPCQIP